MKLKRLSGIELVVALTLLFVSLPFLELLRIGALLESILLTVVLLSAVVAIADRKVITIVAVALAIPTVLGRWMYQFHPSGFPAELFLIGGILFVLFVIINLLRFIVTTAAVNLEVLCASISTFLLLGLLWTFAYWLVAELVPAAFSFNTASGGDTTMKGFNSMYFSFITLCTVGYGDITPVSHVARMLAAMEGVTGLLYVAVLIARLVALHSASRSNEN